MATQFSSLFFLSKEIDLHGQNWSNEADSVQIPIIFSPTFWMPWMWRRVRLIPDAKVPDMHRSVAGIPVWWLNEKTKLTGTQGQWPAARYSRHSGLLTRAACGCCREKRRKLTGAAVRQRLPGSETIFLGNRSLFGCGNEGPAFCLRDLVADRQK